MPLIDILCWNTLFWVKEARSEAFVTWQCGGLDTDELITVWLSLAGYQIERLHAGLAR